MTQAQERLERLTEVARGLPPGQGCWLWMTSGGPDGTPFFVLVAQADDPEGKTFKRRVQWVIENTEQAGVTTRGVLHRLRSGRYTLSTSAPIDQACAVYACACRFAALPDVLMMQLSDARIQASRLVENLAAIEETVGAIAPEQRQWFGIVDGPPAIRFRTASTRPEILGELGEQAIIGQLRRTREDGFELRVRTLQETRQLSLLLQKWSRHDAIHWPTLQRLSGARITSRDPYRLERRDG